MNIANANDFLGQYKDMFAHEALRRWSWSAEDGEFGRLAQWSLNSSDGIECVATVDLQHAVLVLAVTERDITPDGEAGGRGTEIVFAATAAFEDRTLVVDGQEFEYSEAGFRELIELFNKKTVS